MNISVFKTYDIRGVYGTEITEEIAYNIGLKLPKFFNTKQIAVGMDARVSSPSLKKALIQGINKSGAEVLDIGISTTPMLSFTVAYKNLSGGIMISASHNPPEYNAFKVIGKQALQLSSESGLNDLKNMVEADFVSSIPNENIAVENTNIDILNDYIKHILSKFNFLNKVKVVSDFGNGVGSVSALPIFKKIPQIDTFNLFEDLDGTFPNHYADPHHLENMDLLRKKVIEEKADLGLFFDGDADRCYFIDENGNILLADIAFCLLAEEELTKTQQSDKRVYYDLRFTKETVKVIEKNGGTPVMMRVGNPFYKEKLVLDGGLMASEFSGHIMYKENYGIDDGIFAALKLIEILSKYKKPLSSLVRKYQTFHSLPENSIKVEGKDIDLILKKLKEEFKDGHEIIMDGLYIEYPNWWFNLRRSNTEPVVRLRVEATDSHTLDLQNNKILNIINS